MVMVHTYYSKLPDRFKISRNLIKDYFCVDETFVKVKSQIYQPRMANEPTLNLA
jgi:hypothetical protein